MAPDVDPPTNVLTCRVRSVDPTEWAFGPRRAGRGKVAVPIPHAFGAPCLAATTSPRHPVGQVPGSVPVIRRRT